MLTIAATLLVQFAVLASPPPSKAVTCFNGGERGHWVGLWHWDGQKSWKRARDDFAPMFTFVLEPGRERYESADLRYCMYVSDVVAAKTVKCASGFVEIAKLEPGRTLSGRYELTMADGTRQAREFDAVYCKPAWPLQR